MSHNERRSGPLEWVTLTNAGESCERCGERIKYVLDDGKCTCWGCGAELPVEHKKGQGT